MTLYIRNPYNWQKKVSNDDDHNVTESDYSEVDIYEGSEYDVVYTYGGGHQGTGFFIFPNLILTAGHVVRDAAGGSFTIGGGPIPDGQTFQYNTVSTGSAVTSNPLIGTIKTSNVAPGEAQIRPLLAVGRGGNSKIDPNLGKALVEGFPGDAYEDKGLKIQILYSSYDTTKTYNDPAQIPVSGIHLWQEMVDATPSKSVLGQWSDGDATLAAGNSGGPVFALGSDNQIYVVGDVELANATGPTSSYKGNQGGGASGPEFTYHDLQALTQAGKAADLNGGGAGWWNTQPQNAFYASDTANETLVTDDRSDVVVLGQAATNIVASLGNDTIIGDSNVSPNNVLRYATAAGDSALTKADLAEIASVALNVEIGASGFGTMGASVTDTSGGVSTQAITGVSTVVLTNQADTVSLTASPIQVASSDPDLPLPTTTGKSIAIDAGGGANIFNIDYGSGGAGQVLLEGGEDGSTFNIKNAQSASFSVLWGGGGQSTYNISGSGSAPIDLLSLSIDGLNESNFVNLDNLKLENYIDKTYGADPDRIVLLNPTSNDVLNFNGKRVDDATGFATTSVTSMFLGDVKTSSGGPYEPTPYKLSSGDGGPLIEGYIGQDMGYAANEYEDRDYITPYSEPTDSNFVLSPISTGAYGGGPVDLRITDLFAGVNVSVDGVASKADAIDLQLDAAPDIHISDRVSQSELGTVYENGVAVRQTLDAGFYQPGVQDVSQTLDTSGGLTLENFRRGMFGLNFDVTGTVAGQMNSDTLYSVNAWKSSTIQFGSPYDVVQGLAPDLKKSTIVSQVGGPSGLVNRSGEDYFQTDSNFSGNSPLEVTDYLRDPVEFTPDMGDPVAYDTSMGSLDFADLEATGQAAPDALELGGLAPSDVTFTRNNDDLLIQVIPNNASIKIENEFVPGASVRTIYFADGSSFDSNAILAATYGIEIIGTVANQAATPGSAVQPFGGATVADTNSGATDVLTVTLSGSGGTLSGAGLMAVSSGIYTLSGPASQITEELHALIFTPEPGQTGKTTFSLVDQSSAYANAVMDATTSVLTANPSATDTILNPSISGTITGLTTTSEIPMTPFATVVVGDPNAGASDTLYIDLYGSGSLTDGAGFSGLTAGQGTGAYLLSGTAGSISAELSALVFTPGKGVANTSYATSFTLYLVSSTGTKAADSTTSVIDVDPAVLPTISGTQAGQRTVSEAAVVPFATVSIGDVNADATDALYISLFGGGTLVDGAGFSGLAAGSSAGNYLLNGSAAAITNELNSLVFTPALGAPNTDYQSTFTLYAASSAGTSVADNVTSVIDVDPAVAPSITGTQAGQVTTSDAALAPFAHVVISDTNVEATDTLYIDVYGSGTIKDGGGFSGLSAGQGKGSYVLAGTAAAITSELNALVFMPGSGPANTAYATSFTLYASSSTGMSIADSTTNVTDVDPAAAPVISGIGGSTITASRKPIAPLQGTITDLNANSTDTATIQVTGGAGTLTDGKGFSDLSQTSNTGVYALSSSSASNLTSEFNALSWTPGTSASQVTDFFTTITSSSGMSASSGALSFAGANQSVSLAGTSTTAVNDMGHALIVAVLSNTQTDEFSGFGTKDTTGVVDFKDGVGGFSSVNDIMGALQSDGHGGTLIKLETIGSIDFLSTPQASLHASNFRIG